MSSQQFVHLHVHSDFSLLDGACKIKKLIGAAEKFGMPAIALTDHGNLRGVIQFYSAAKDAGIKPIIGYEAYVAPGSRLEKSSEGEAFHHLTLLAENITGYQNLIQLSSKAYLEGFYYKPRVDKELLEQYSEGLIALSGCLSSELNKLLLRGDFEGAIASAVRYREIFGDDNFFLEIQDNGLDEQKTGLEGTLKVSKELGIPVVATNDIHYLERSDARAHEALLCVNTGKTIHDESRMKMETDEFYFKSGEEMAERFGHVEGAVENPFLIAERCNVELDFDARHFPRFDPKAECGKDLTDVEFLRELCDEGFAERYAGNQGARERLDYELTVIGDMGYSSYFLIVWDFVRYARGQGIPTSMRGSGVGSVVSYVLGLIDLDPLKHDLIFQRFLDPERKEPPDIDIDFCEHGRETVMQYVKDKYGLANTAQIITFGAMKAKAVVRDVGRALDIPLGEINRIAKLIPSALGTELADALEKVPELKEMRQSGEKSIQELFDISLRLEGVNRHPSIHAAGLCIADEPLTDHIPICKVGDIVATQFAMNDLDKVGMLKMDFLGVRFLTIVDKTLNIIEERTGKRPDMMNLPTDDRPTYDLLTAGKGRGVFQMGSSGMRNLLAKLKPDNLEDIIAVVGLYRPGPLQSGMVDDFINRKHGLAEVTYQHPSLEKVLKTTHGVIVYQEQIMRLAHEIGGLSMAEALSMIKAISKKKLELVSAPRDKFISGAVERGLSQRVAEDIFELIQHFAGYGFNKAHTTAYAYLAYWTAYLKANYPVEFMAATLSCEMDDTDKVYEYVDECKQMGIELLPPCVNESGREFRIVEGDKVRFGLSAIKGIGGKAIDMLVDARNSGGPFKSLFSFCERVDPRAVNRSAIEALIKSGAFDCTGANRPTLQNQIDRALKSGASAHADRAAGQMSLFGGQKQPDDEVKMQQVPDWADNEKLKFEKDALGFYFSGHPLEQYRELLDAHAQADIAALSRMDNKESVVVGGLIGQVTRMVTKAGRFAGQSMARFRLDSETSSCQCTIFSEAFNRFSDYVEEDRAVFVVGKVDLSGNSPGIRVDEIVPMKSAREKFTGELHIRLDREAAQADTLPAMRKTFMDHPGDCMVLFDLRSPSGDDVTIKVGRRFYVKTDDAFHLAITQLVEPGDVEYHSIYGNGRKVVEEATPLANAAEEAIEEEELAEAM